MAPRESDHLADIIDKCIAGLDRKREKPTHIPTRWEEAVAAGRRTPLDEGHAVMDAIRACMARYDTDIFTRSEDQKIAHHFIDASLVRFIYGKAFEANQTAIKKYNRFENLKTGTVLPFPRRGGKSFLTAMKIVALMLCIPNIRISVIAANSLSAGEDSGIMGYVLKLFDKTFHKDKSKFERCNEDTIKLRMSQGDVRECHFYSGKSKQGYALVYVIGTLSPSGGLRAPPRWRWRWPWP